jgi:hypothetical protein
MKNYSRALPEVNLKFHPIEKYNDSCDKKTLSGKFLVKNDACGSVA